MPTPVAIPAQCPASSDHGTGYITAHRGHAPSRSPVTNAVADRGAAHGGTLKQHVSFHTASGWHTEQSDKSIAGLDSSGIGAWLVRTAATIHLPGSYACQPHMRAFGATDRPFISFAYRGAGKYLTGWNNRHCREEKKSAEHTVAFSNIGIDHRTSALATPQACRIISTQHMRPTLR